MENAFKIGIVGQGFVGNALKEGIKDCYENVLTFDKDVSKCNTPNLDFLNLNSDIIFVCVPTPMQDDGSCYTGIVEDVISEINYLNKDLTSSKKIVVIKSTIPPGTTEKINLFNKNIEVMFNPEFLTEANAINDFKNQDRIILGGTDYANEILEKLYSNIFKDVPIIKTNSTTAEMVKYVTNSFLATKVSFANEMYQICSQIDIDYDEVLKISIYDKRLGVSHWQVPGPDKKYGFGGSCFPKDVQALIQFSSSLNLDLDLLKSVWKSNLKSRPEKDWMELEGRAVLKKDKQN